MTTPTDDSTGPEDRGPADVERAGMPSDLVDAGGQTEDVPVGAADADADARQAGGDPAP
ncbi:MAG: hypothetical protein M3P46_07155 [Actinomycetota bacterium]|nr:hypothetical protein [Actinomycetota bacterium]